MNTKSIGPFLGINTRLPDFSLRTKEGDFVRDALDCFTDDGGNFHDIAGLDLVQAMSGAHSLRKVGAGYAMVRASVLYSVTLPAYSETLAKLLTSDAPMSYADFAGSTYFSNGTDSGRIEGGTVYPMGLDTPATPAVTQVAGSMPAGQYQVAVAYINTATGERGGVSASSNPEIVGTGSLRVTLPATIPGATHVEVYVSTLNGSVPMLAQTVPVGTASADVSASGTGMEASQRFEDVLPAGSLFMFNGALCSFSGNCVYEGLPFRPGYYLPAEGRIPFPATVTNVVPAQNGVYVVADQTYWISGTRMSKSEQIIDVLPYGGVPNTAFSHPTNSTVGWFGEKGFVVADTQGQVSSPMAEVVTSPVIQSSAVEVIDADGTRLVKACGWCMNLKTFAVTRYDNLVTSYADGYATKSDGLYALSNKGSAWVIDFGKLSMGAEQLKRVPALYIGASSESVISARIQTPQHDCTYAARASSSSLKIQRVDPGKGLRANWFNLSLLGDGVFSLASVSAAAATSDRRI